MTRRLNVSSEMQNLIKLDYYSIVDYLNKKYGNVPAPYFTDSSMNNKNKVISATNRGLFIHHVAESLYINLSASKSAKRYSFELQQPDELVYCNYLEHLLLHVKIVEEWPNRKDEDTRVGWGGIYSFLAPTLNDLYSGWAPEKPWQKSCWNEIKNSKDDYIFLISYLNSIGEYSPQLYSSFNQKFGTWENEMNQKLYLEFADQGIPKYTLSGLKQNDNRMNKNSRVTDDKNVPTSKKHSKWKWFWIAIAVIFVLIIFGVAFVAKKTILG